MKEKIYITGIGSRKTPKSVLIDMETIGQRVRALGMRLRSGHCDGADLAFERGALEACIAYVPWPAFNAHVPTHAKIVCPRFTKAVRELARKHHPVFDRLGMPAQKLIMRNGVQVLGQKLNRPSAVVICWTEGGKVVGGTAQAISIAKDPAHGIPVLNLFDWSLREVLDALMERAGR